MQGVSFREDIMDGRSEDPVSARPVQISSQELRTAVLPLEPQAAEAVPQVSSSYKHAVHSFHGFYSVDPCSSFSYSHFGDDFRREVRVSFLFYSVSGSFCSVCLLFSCLVFGRLVVFAFGRYFFVYTCRYSTADLCSQIYMQM